MIKIFKIILIAVLFTVTACQQDDFFDKFPPEIMFYQNAKVENANFNEITLPAATTEYTVKARVSAPFKLKEIQIFVVSGATETLLNTINSFGNTPNEFYVNQKVTGISGNTDVKFVAWDMDGRKTSKIFKVIVN
jgi:hypothetical protein